MAQVETPLELSGKLLIAMPGMGDPRFEKSVVYMCAHSPDGAMGLIVNKQAPGLEFSDMMAQLDLPLGKDGQDIRVHFGGPVEGGRGFVLHSRDYHSETANTLEIDPQFGLTATMEILRDMAAGKGPARRLVALGYAGWGPGQLEDEISDNGWLTAEADPDPVFGLADGDKWAAALGTLGIDPILLSASAGRA